MADQVFRSTGWNENILGAMGNQDPDELEDQGKGIAAS